MEVGVFARAWPGWVESSDHNTHRDGEPEPRFEIEHSIGGPERGGLSDLKRAI